MCQQGGGGVTGPRKAPELAPPLGQGHAQSDASSWLAEVPVQAPLLGCLGYFPIEFLSLRDFFRRGNDYVSTSYPFPHQEMLTGLNGFKFGDR